MIKKLKQIREIKNNYKIYANECDYKKTFTAKILDSISICIVVWLTSFLLGGALTKNIVIGMLFSLALLTCTTIVLHRNFKMSYKNLQKKSYRKIRIEKIREQINQLTPNEFQELLIKTLLESQIISRSIMRDSFIEGVTTNRRYAIQWHMEDGQKITNWNIVEAFARDMQSQGFNHIIFVTNTEFEDKCHILKKFFQDTNIYLIDRECLINLLAESKIGPDDVIIESIMEKKRQYNIQIAKTKKNDIITRKKIKTSIIYATIFLALAFIVRKYSIYYIITSALFFVLAILMHIISGKKDIQSHDIVDIKRGVEQ